MYESIAAAAREAAATPGDAARMLLVFSDGLPTTTTRAADAAAQMAEFGIPVYPVILGHAALMERTHDAMQKPKPGEFNSNTLTNLEHEQLEVLDFARLADLTGGRSFDPPEITLTVMRQVLAGLVAQVRTEYVVGFSPAISAELRTHKLEIRRRDKNLGKVMGGARTVRY